MVLTIGQLRNGDKLMSIKRFYSIQQKWEYINGKKIELRPFYEYFKYMLILYIHTSYDPSIPIMLIWNTKKKGIQISPYQKI